MKIFGRNSKKSVVIGVASIAVVAATTASVIAMQPNTTPAPSKASVTNIESTDKTEAPKENETLNTQNVTPTNAAEETVQPTPSATPKASTADEERIAQQCNYVSEFIANRPGMSNQDLLNNIMQRGGSVYLRMAYENCVSAGKMQPLV